MENSVTRSASAARSSFMVMLLLTITMLLMPVLTGASWAQETAPENPPAATTGEDAAPQTEPDDADTTQPGHSLSEQFRSRKAEAEIPEIQTDLSKLPFPVRKMRELLLEAARSGEVAETVEPARAIPGAERHGRAPHAARVIRRRPRRPRRTACRPGCGPRRCRRAPCRSGRGRAGISC